MTSVLYDSESYLSRFVALGALTVNLHSYFSENFHSSFFVVGLVGLSSSS